MYTKFWLWVFFCFFFLFKFAFAIGTHSPGLVLAFLLTLNLPSQQDTVKSSRAHKHLWVGRQSRIAVFLETCPWRPRVNILVQLNLCQLCNSVFVFLTYLNICFTRKELPRFDNIGNICLSLLRDFNEHLSSVGRGYRTICLYFVRSPHFLVCVGCVHGMKKTMAMFIFI